MTATGTIRTRGSWRKSTKRKHPRTHKRIKIRDTSGSYTRTYYYYFSSLNALNAWIDDLEDGDITVAGVGGSRQRFEQPG